MSITVFYHAMSLTVMYTIYFLKNVKWNLYVFPWPNMHGMFISLYVILYICINFTGNHGSHFCIFSGKWWHDKTSWLWNSFDFWRAIYWCHQEFMGRQWYTRVLRQKKRVPAHRLSQVVSRLFRQNIIVQLLLTDSVK